MAIYLLLIVFILLLPIIVNSKKQDHKNKIITSVGMTAIFLILALKGDVGSDISGYLEQYYISASKDWHNVDYVYFESGYIYLMKIFSKSGCSFQLYMAFVYALACFAMYLFIRKYSLNPTFSLLIFVCYMFFVFYISGVRQTIAMSLCILAFITLQKKKRTTFVISSLMILLSTTIHQSAIVFFGILLLQLIKNKRINIFLYWGLTLAAIILRPWIWDLVNKYFREVDLTTEIALGGNFIAIIGISFVMYIVNVKHNYFKINLSRKDLDNEKNEITLFCTRALLLSLPLFIAFAGHSMTRATMYYLLFMIVGLPNSTYRFDKKSRFIVEYIFAVFFIALFYFETLEPNQLELCPYKFYWE